MKRRRKLVVGYENFGPYHIARLKALAEHCELLAIEFAARSRTYNWAPHEPSNFRRTTLTGVIPPNNSYSPTSELYRTLSAFEPDAVFIPGWFEPLSFAMLNWCKRRNVPAILMSDSQEIDEPRTRTKELLKGQLTTLFDGALVAGVRHAHYLKKLGFSGRPIATPYDVIDNDHFSPPEAISGLAVRQSLFCCARLVEKKNLFVLLSAYKIFLSLIGTETGTPPKLLIAGDGPLRDALDSLILSLGLREQAVLLGFIDYHDLPKLYHSAEIFILPSRVEQWGLVVNEAMAAGCPVLVSERAGCVPELVETGQNGFVFSPDDPSHLAHLLLLIHQSKDMALRFGSRSRKIISSFGLRQHCHSILELAEAACGGKAREPSISRQVILSAILEGVTWWRTA